MARCWPAPEWRGPARYHGRRRLKLAGLGPLIARYVRLKEAIEGGQGLFVAVA